MSKTNKYKTLILTTGGTIDKTYDELDGSLRNTESMIQRFVLNKLRLPGTELKVSQIMGKDSLQMNDEDRDVIYRVVKNNLREKCPIVIIHGTDTMEITAKHLYERLENLQVPIVLTGAMRPIGFEDSDGRQNITESLMASKLLSPGVYLSFHGQVFEVPNVTKDRERGTFIHK